MTLTVQQIQQRLEEIESDAQQREVPGENAARDHARLNRKYELRYAQEFVKAEGTPTEKRQKALVAVAADQELWNELIAAEAAHEGWKAGMRSRELRTTIGQSLLRNQREMGG